tara:strand:+ start:229 stop:516 length:288 start_codon:yes stop_codon:yes gene_type:complete
MINNSVSKAYININALSKQVEKADTDGIPKNMDKESKQKKKKGLLSRSNDMIKYQKDVSESSDSDKEQQKLVIAYVLRIRQAFKEVQNGRADTKS